LLRVIGHGAYGEVWLAKNLTTNIHRAIKVIRRAEFETERPCQREFEGLLKYEPISAPTPGWCRCCMWEGMTPRGTFIM